MVRCALTPPRADAPGKFDELVEGPLGVKVLVDNKALMHVVGTRMDFVSDRLRRAARGRASLCTAPLATHAPTLVAPLQVRICLQQPQREGRVRVWRVLYNMNQEEGDRPTRRYVLRCWPPNSSPALHLPCAALEPPPLALSRVKQRRHLKALLRGSFLRVGGCSWLCDSAGLPPWRHR